MAGKSREDVLGFYENFRQHSGWEFLEAMRVFLPRLFRERERELEDCQFLTSHATLCISRFPYPQCTERPGVFINCTAKDRLQIDFRVWLSSEPVARYVTESANCPIELGLEEFDRLYAKFVAAHETPPSGGK